MKNFQRIKYKIRRKGNVLGLGLGGNFEDLKIFRITLDEKSRVKI